MTKHIVKGFDQDLNKLSQLVNEMGNDVLEQFSDGLKCIFDWDEELFDKIMKGDNNIDSYEEKIIDFAIEVLTLRQPVSTDLRQVIAALRIACDLERMGDCSQNLVRRASKLPRGIMADDGILGRDIVDNIGQLMFGAGEQVEGVLESYRNKDDEQSIKFWVKDDKLDDLYALSAKGVVRIMSGNREDVNVFSNILFIIKEVERIGDHATNIAESVHYMVTGRRLKSVLPKWFYDNE